MELIPVEIQTGIHRTKSSSSCHFKINLRLKSSVIYKPLAHLPRQWPTNLWHLRVVSSQNDSCEAGSYGWRTFCRVHDPRIAPRQPLRVHRLCAP